MAANTLPSGINDLFFLAARLQAGLAKHGPWIQVDDAAALAEKLAQLRETEEAYAAARGRKAAAGQRFVVAEERLTAWLAKARLVVMLALGSEWTERWLAAGFTHRATHVPKRLGARIELAGRLARFFAAHPAFAVVFAGVTAEDAAAMNEEIRSAEAEVRAAKVLADRRKRARDAAEKELRKQMRCTIVWLWLVLPKDDPRWLDFGLQQPTRGRTRQTGNAAATEIIDLAPAEQPAAAVA